MVSLLGIEAHDADWLCEAVLSEGIKEEGGIEAVLVPVPLNK